MQNNQNRIKYSNFTSEVVSHNVSIKQDPSHLILSDYKTHQDLGKSRDWMNLNPVNQQSVPNRPENKIIVD